MNKNSIDISIIIVQYKVKDLLHECIRSLIKNVKGVTYEIIVVDNDDVKIIKEDLTKDFPNVKYIANTNAGFGQGNNTGVKSAKGNYLFFLNPDTTVFSNCIESLKRFLDDNSDVGIAAPLLVHEDGKLFELQGMNILTPLRGIVALSFLNKLFPSNPISRNYWLPKWDHTKIKEVGVVPGTAFMISRELYESIKGFDDKFFLYFEEFDLCKRVKEQSLRVVMLPQAKVMHLWGKSTQQRADINAVFQQSRFYYFTKNFGLPWALIVELFTRLSKEAIAMGLILLGSSVFLLSSLNKFMIMIGDQAWFYLSARDLLLGKEFPLVGITSSHTWLHQGALWTYLLAIFLWIGRFNPFAGGYLSIGIHLLTILFIYLLGKKMTSKIVALMASLLYATSPYVLALVFMPYHTTPIPLLSLFYFYSLFCWVRGKSIYMTVSLISLALLYNVELATVVLGVPFAFLFIYGLWKKRVWVTNLRKNHYLSALGALVLAMLPIIVYDTTHGFKQTVVYGGWLVRTVVLSLVSVPTQAGGITQTLSFLAERLQQLVFVPSLGITLILTLVSVAFLFWKSVNDLTSGRSILALWLLVAVLAIVANKTPSDAYLPMLFPVIFLAIADFSSIFNRQARLISLVLVGSVVLLNVGVYLRDNYLKPEAKVLTVERTSKAVTNMLQTLDNEPFHFIGTGSGSQFESFVMPYDYIAWYLGRPSSKAASLGIIIAQDRNKVTLTKQYDK